MTDFPPDPKTESFDISSIPADQLGGHLPIRLGRYQLVSLIGEGGMARVFEAVLQGPAGFRKTVAIKIIKSSEDGDKARAGLMKEAVLACRLNHPNIVDIYELVEEAGRTFIAMEWVDGSTLTQLIRSWPPMPPPVVLEVFLSLLDGIEYAHTPRIEASRPGMLHKDIKPANILISRHGIPKLVDFGIAAQLQAEPLYGPDGEVETQGTISWMSPEQLLGDVLDERSDLFSLCLVVATTVLGGHPFPEKFLYKTLMGGRLPPVRLLSEAQVESIDRIVSGLGPILERGLRRDRDQRYRDAAELRAELAEVRDRIGYRPTLARWLVDRDQLAEDAGLGGSDETTRDVPRSNAWVSDTTQVVIQGNLKDDHEPFFGRVDEFATLQEYIERGLRLITLVGTGGCGKTRLSRRVARRFVDRLEGGAWFVDLSAAESVEDVVRATAGVLGISLSTDSTISPIEEIGAVLELRGRVLLVMDNFEQVLEAAPLTIGKWMAMAPSAQFLVTTRRASNLSGERRILLSPLSRNEAISLLRQRVELMGAEWPEDAETGQVLQDIVETLDRLPLAIELAAARSRLLTPIQLRDRLSERFALLRSESRDTDSRQSTLHGLIDWSWQRLEPWERSALAQLSVFRGGFTMEAAEAVLLLSAWAEAPWSLDVVGELLQKSLLYHTQSDGQPRFFMYVSIREFASLRLREENAPVTGTQCSSQALRRHSRFFSTLVTADGAGGGRAVKRKRAALIEREFENLECGARRGVQPYRALCALTALELLMTRGPMSQALDLIGEHLGNSDLPPSLEVRLRILQTRCLRLSGRIGEARSALEEAQNRAESTTRTGDPDSVRELRTLRDDLRLEDSDPATRALEVEGMIEQAHLSRLEGDLATGHRILEEALGRCHPRTDILLQAKVQMALGWLLWARGRVRDSLFHLQQSRAGFRVSEEHVEEASCLSALGYVTSLSGQPKNAHSLFVESLALIEAHGDISHRRLVLSRMANVERSIGLFAESLEHFDQVIRLQAQVGDVATGILNRIDRCTTLMAMKRDQEAEDSLQEIWVLARQQEAAAYEVMVRITLGHHFLDTDRVEEAGPHLHAAMDFAKGRFPTIESSVAASLSVVLSARGEREEVEAILEGQEHSLTAMPLSHVDYLVNVARSAWNLGDADRARSILDRAMRIGRKVDVGLVNPTLAKCADWQLRFEEDPATEIGPTRRTDGNR